MEKYENIIKIEEIRRLVEGKEYFLAAQIVDSMDISKVKATTDLSTIAYVFINRERYDEAIDVLNKMYEKSATRRVVFQLLEVSIKTEDINLAKRYYDEYISLAPRDPSKYIFQYLIKKLENSPIEEQIIPLKELKKYEYIEEWAYELASLYHKAGMKDECIEECKDIIIWFGTGDYVRRAELLKGYHEGKVDLIDLLEDKEEDQPEHNKEDLEENKEEYNNEDLEDRLESNKEDLGNSELENDRLTLEGNELKEEEAPVIKEEEITKEEEVAEASNDLIDDFFANKNIDYKEIFGDYLENVNIKEQIAKAFIEINNHDMTYNNILITSKSSFDTQDRTLFAKAMLKALFKQGYILCNKVGVLGAKAFNKIDSVKKRKSLRNCSLIIEDAHLLETNSIDEIEDLILNKEQKIVFVLQGSEKEIEKLFDNYPQFYLYFNISVNL